ncbi:MAG: hypothetical protein D4R45_02475, partial [Planctomycetaceae bacterium]
INVDLILRTLRHLDISQWILFKLFALNGHSKDGLNLSEFLLNRCRPVILKSYFPLPDFIYGL